MKLETAFDGFTKLKNWWKTVKGNFETIQEEHNAEVNAREEHAAQVGSDTVSGHVKLSDSYESTSGVSGGTAATPLAVSDARQSAINYSLTKAQALDAVLQTAIDEKVDKTQYASATQAGIMQLYSVNGVNRSGLLAYDGGVIVVNTNDSYGLTRTGDGKVVTAPASESDIDALSNGYKPITPKTLSYAVQAVGGQLEELTTTDKTSYTAAINEVAAAVSDSSMITLLNGKVNKSVGTQLITTASTLVDAYGTTIHAVGDIGVIQADDGNEYYILSDITTVSGPKTTYTLTWARLATEDMITAEATARENAINDLQSNITTLDVNMTNTIVDLENADERLAARLDAIEAALGL